MLIDSGGSDAIWLFENSKSKIKTSKRFFNDILGESLSGSILGKRSRIPKLKIGRFEIKAPTVSFLDSLFTLNARKFKNRNGSLRGNILKRFTVCLDYSQKQIMFKKNVFFKADFNYNTSGLDIVYSGRQLIKQEFSKPSTFGYGKQGYDGGKTISFIIQYHFKFKVIYEVRKVLKNSVAERAGLKAGDVVLAINRKLLYS
jgi:hypothetical protein